MGAGKFFIELNATNDVLNLQDYTLITGVAFSFPAGSLTQGEFVIVANLGLDMETFIGMPVTHLYETADLHLVDGNMGFFLLKQFIPVDMYADGGITHSTDAAWSYQSGWAKRKPEVPQPIIFHLSDWTLNTGIPNLKDCDYNWKCGGNAYPFFGTMCESTFIHYDTKTLITLFLLRVG